MICRNRNSLACGFCFRCSRGRQSAHSSIGIEPESQRRLTSAATIELKDLVPFIDWSPFFHTWELRGVYPKILQHEKHGEEARKLFADAQKLLEKIVGEKLIQPRGVYGFFPANRVGDDVEALPRRIAREGPEPLSISSASKSKRADGTPNWCLADFVAPKHRHQHPTSDVTITSAPSPSPRGTA